MNSHQQDLPLPALVSDHASLARAWRIALGDLAGNVQPFQDGLLEQPQPVLLAGLDYDTPWTRDAAINTWNGLGLLWPAVAHHTLLSVLERRAGQLFIGGQYWDAVIWALGAWAYYLHGGDRRFLELACQAVENSLAHFSQAEYDPQLGLFRGPAVYGDGVAAYPDRYSPGGTSSILDWVQANPEKRAGAGYGIPMLALSTNCVYRQAFVIANRMRAELGLALAREYDARAAALGHAIQAQLWDPQAQAFRYFIDPEGACEHQEGLGNAFALLFDLVTPAQAHAVLANQPATPFGVPCVWPTFARYARHGGFGRHSGTVWPFISGFWGEAALRHGRPDLFATELAALAAHLNRHAQCAEILHPETGEVYGGLQEAGRGASGLEWTSCARQSWSASAYLRLVLHGLCGLRFEPGGVAFQPYLPPGVAHLQLSGLRYRQAVLELNFRGQGGQIQECRINGQPVDPHCLAVSRGSLRIEITLFD